MSAKYLQQLKFTYASEVGKSCAWFPLGQERSALFQK